MSVTPSERDYSLIGQDSKRAVDSGLAAAEWYHTDIPRKQMKELMQRSDQPAIRDTAIWLGCLVAFGTAASLLWGSWWCAPLFLCYGVLYGSATDSRWHECGHGTAFKTRWMNDAVYQLACFMIMREPTIWRWSHTRHHTDTIIVGRDPEIAAMRPPDLAGMLLNIFALEEHVHCGQTHDPARFRQVDGGGGDLRAGYGEAPRLPRRAHLARYPHLDRRARR